MRVIAGTAKGLRLKAPVGDTTRPIMDRVKTALFDILAPDITGAIFLDLFGGIGNVGIEALSRGAQHVTFIELTPAIARILEENLKSTKLQSQADVVRGDAFQYLTAAAQTGKRFDIIYVAPPQYRRLAVQAVKQVDTLNLLLPSGYVIAQIHPKERNDFDSAIWQRMRLVDERTYGSTLLLFYQQQPE